MWIVLVIVLTTAGIESGAMPTPFNDKRQCERAAMLSEAFMRAEVDDPEAPIWATCFQIPDRT